MSWDWTVKVTDLAIIFATIVGPILAVQAQKWLESWGETKQRRLRVFQSLMSTRATRLAPLHVEALNSIEIEFYGEKQIIEIYRSYLDHLQIELGTSPTEAAFIAWNTKRDEIFIELLYTMSRLLKYDFDKVQIKRGAYYPVGHGNIENQLNAIREGFQKVLSGDQAIAMRVTEFPYDISQSQEAADRG